MKKLDISQYVTRENYSHRGGGVEIELSCVAQPGQYLSAYQNYLGGGMLASVQNDSTIRNWAEVPELFELARQLREYYWEQMHEYGYVDEYNEDVEARPASYPGL